MDNLATDNVMGIAETEGQGVRRGQTKQRDPDLDQKAARARLLMQRMD